MLFRSQHVAINRVREVFQMCGRNVLKRRDHFYRLAESALQRQHCRAVRRQLHAAHFRRHQRHGYIDENFSGKLIAQGQATEVMQDSEVVSAYLGRPAHA